MRPNTANRPSFQEPKKMGVRTSSPKKSISPTRQNYWGSNRHLGSLTQRTPKATEVKPYRPLTSKKTVTTKKVGITAPPKRTPPVAPSTLQRQARPVEYVPQPEPIEIDLDNEYKEQETIVPNIPDPTPVQ